jgi:DNA replication and repair protein RecF
MDRGYCQRLSQFQKVVTQRNSLLKQLREDGASARDAGVVAQLAFWDEQLVSHGAFVMARRYQILAQMDPLARQGHAALSDGSETLHLLYLPSFNPGHLSQADYARLKQGATDGDLLPFPQPELTPGGIAQAYQAKLVERRARELAAGNTLYGPHRDDMAFVVNGRDLRTYGSRGQQRSAALSLKLAELETMTAVTGETPLLLLDDVMSELDAVRRSMLLAALGQVTQAIITTTDWSDFTPDFLAQAQQLTVRAGQVEGIGE